MQQRKIIHVDMDAFFVSVEEHDNPDLKGHPVVVGHDGPRGVVATANYTARKFGIHSALPIVTAHRLCKDLIVVEGRYQRYREISEQIRNIFREYTDVIEPLSLDEAFLDVTRNKKGMPLAVDIASEIKKRIFEETGLTASAGVSYCKFLAKIASDYRKPDGLCTIHPDRALGFIDRLKVEQFWGVGEKTAQHLHKMGVFTGRELREVPLETLRREFGKTGQIFYDFARGIDDRPVVTEFIRKSLGCERTYPKDLESCTEMLEELSHLANELTERLKKHGFTGSSLVLKIKYSDFRQTTHCRSCNKPIETFEEIFSITRELLGEVDAAQRPVRLLGLSVTNPVQTDDANVPQQMTFDW
ncbi:DNA polymerase IV [bacterium]|nr:DNA polymerase IV [bacterium]